MTHESLEGKVALVTGASRGVGAAAAVALAAAGARVACAARSTAGSPQSTPGTIDETVERVRSAGGEAMAVPTNLADEAQVEAMVDAAVTAFGGLDILVNNAAVTFPGDVALSLRRHDLIMDINLRAPLVASRRALPHLRRAEAGRILNVSSVAALVPIPGLMAYGISKIGLEHLTLDLARELQLDGIAVNCFRIDVPVASEGFVANLPDADHSDWEPSDVAAEGIVWMLHQPASYTGQRESMHGLRHREGIMVSRSARPYGGVPVTELYTGVPESIERLFHEKEKAT